MMFLFKHKRILSFILILISCSTFNWYCKTEPVSWSKRGVYASLSDSAHYTGMQVCSGCHTGIHETFIHTGMGKSFDKASKLKSSGKFDYHPVVYDRYRDFYYAPHWENDSLKFTEFRLEQKDTIYKRTETVQYIIGSGQHTNSHMWVSNGFVYQAPLTFYVQKGIWDLPPGFENGNNSGFNRMIGLECMSCHNAYPEFVAGSENKYNLVRNGIDCERCHGPGSIHVQEKSKGILIDTAVAVDFSIVNPSKLPVNLQFDICQRCHVQGNAVLKEGKSFFDFKPGMKLSEVMDVYMPLYEGNNAEHIMASHAERLKQSKCYVVTSANAEKEMQNNHVLRPYKNALTCITCHNPHVSVRSTDPEIFNKTCVNCHHANNQKVCKEDTLVRLQKRNSCTGCHMPFNGTTDIPHVSVHDHKIAIPLKTKEIDGIRRMKGVICLNNNSPDQLSRAEAYLNYFEKFGMGTACLDSAEKILSHFRTSSEKTAMKLIVRMLYLKNEMQKLADYISSQKNMLSKFSTPSYSNDDAWTAYRIGEAFFSVNKTETALIYYRTAYQLAPLSAAFSNKYALSLASLNKTLEAENIFRKLITDHPEFATGFCNLGYLLQSTGHDQQEVLSYYNKALSLDPDYEPALLNLAGLYLQHNDTPNAVNLLKRILKRNPENVKVQQALRQLKIKI